MFFQTTYFGNRQHSVVCSFVSVNPSEKERGNKVDVNCGQVTSAVESYLLAEVKVNIFF